MTHASLRNGREAGWLQDVQSAVQVDVVAVSAMGQGTARLGHCATACEELNEVKVAARARAILAASQFKNRLKPTRDQFQSIASTLDKAFLQS